MLVETALKKDFQVRYSEIDYDLTLKPSAILHFLEDVASVNAENLGFGYTFVRNNNLAWFLLKYRMEFNKYPQNISTLTVKTRPRGYNKLFAFRDFELYSDNELLARITSTWSLIDLTTRNIVSAEKMLADLTHMASFQKEENDLIYQKIRPIDKVDFEKTFEVRYNDIDVNGHANNSNYIIWALEPLNLDFRSKNEIKTIDIVFKKEIKYGEELISQVKVENNQTLHVLKTLNSNEDLCLVAINWSQK